MHRHVIMTLAALLAVPACASLPRSEKPPVTTPKPAQAAAKNPMLEPWSGPYGGVPAFDAVRVADFKPALEAAMETARHEIAKIAHDPSPVTFENTCAALEDVGRTLSRVEAYYSVWESTMSDDAFQAVEREMAPKLAAFEDEIIQNEALFARLAQLYAAREDAGLSAEQKRLIWHRYTDFVLAGAQLNQADKQQLAALNQQLASLYTEFSQNVLAEEEDFALVIETEADLAGLPDSLREEASAAAQAKGIKGWAIANTRSAVEPFLTLSTRRDLRERVFRKFVMRGDNGNAHDNNALVTLILQLRARRAKLLGYPTHAHWRLQDSMAKTPEAALTLMEAVWKPARERVKREVADMQALADREPEKITIAPWDYRYYAEKVRKATYDLDQNDLKPYLQLDKLREAMFWVAGELFGLGFEPISDVPVYQPDVKVWLVKDKTSTKPIGLWYFDPYARAGKHSGAWMSPYRDQERFRGEVLTIVSNNANFVKPKPGEPSLLAWDDAVTLFHEFGHALHGLASNVSYPSLSGTSVARDYVEFPSQLLEHWLLTPEVLSRFALHHQTGAPMPQALLEKIKRAKTFNQGFDTVEYLATALVDMKLHLAGDTPIDPHAFERDTLKALEMPEQIVMRHRIPQLSHVFAGDSYSAGYYSYLWADTITADAYEAFTEAGGAYDPKVAARLKQYVFSVGNTVDPAEGYRAFRGRDPNIDALMRKRGFPVRDAKH